MITGTTVETAIPEQLVGSCIACCETLRQGATLCPHCRSSQRPKRWKIAGTVLKWIGGTTAVLSLLIGAVRVDEIYDNWREGHEAVVELIRAAQLQVDAGDYSGGWSSVQQALELRPTSSNARAFQVDLAMAWIRDVRVTEGGSFSDIVDRLLPVLYRGTSGGESEYTADVFSHIGWANYLKFRDDGRTYTIEDFYRRSLQLDADNTFAHLFIGHWYLTSGWRSGDFDKQQQNAMQHYKSALQGGREHGYVATFVLRTLLECSKTFCLEQAVHIANSIRQMDRSVDKDTARRLIRSIGRPYTQNYLSENELKQLLNAAPANELLITYRWLLDTSELPQEHTGYEYVIARLMEASGDESGSLQLYRSLQTDATSNPVLTELLVAAFSRLNQE